MAGTYAFVDGGYLRARFTDTMTAFYGIAPPVNFEALRFSLNSARLFYYDAIDFTQRDKENEDDYHKRIGDRLAFHAYINSLSGWHVREGHVRQAKLERKREQKGVDVMISVDAMEHAARRNMDLATLLAGDLDFEPLVHALLRLGVPTRLLYAPTNVSDLLKAAADDRHKITLQQFFDWSPASFRATHKQVRLDYGTERPGLPIFNKIREGQWDNRAVTLFEPTNHSNGRIHVEAGDELTEQSLTMEYIDAARLPLAFELTFGPIAWA